MTGQPETTRPLVEAERLEVSFGHKAKVRAVDDVSLAVARGETFGVIGESGSGKSTLGRALVSMLRPTAGRVLHEGIDPVTLGPRAFRAHRRHYQIVFQDPNAALDPRMTILDSVREPLDIEAAEKRSLRDARAVDVMEKVGLPASFAPRFPHELSGGQKQRVNIARALTARPRLLVCDEVVAALDISIQADILNLLASLQAAFDLTYVFITHDLAVVSHISDRIAVMYLGRFVEVGPAAELRRQPLHPYSEALLSAEPTPLPAAMRRRDRIILEGEIPSPVSPPSGCRFRTRCRYAVPRCAADVPELREILPGRRVACHFAGSPGLSRPDEGRNATAGRHSGHGGDKA